MVLFKEFSDILVEVLTGLGGEVVFEELFFRLEVFASVNVVVRVGKGLFRGRVLVFFVVFSFGIFMGNGRRKK